MNEEERLKKNEQIKKSLKLTRERRVNQKCSVYELKIDTSKMNKSNFIKLKKMFLQCKWLYNYLLSLPNEELMKFDTKTRSIYKFDKDGNKIDVELDIPAKFIQSVYQVLKQNIVSLSRKKKKGKNKIGKLKFKSDYNSIDLNQYNRTHQIRSKNKIFVMGFKKLFKVFGLEQIPENIEFANAKLVKKPSGFYIILTCYKNLTINSFKSNQRKKEVGLDYGIKTHITTSENEQFNVTIEESERLKGLQRKLSRQKKGSNNYYRTRQKLQREYEKLSNQKKDKCNKLVNYLCSNYSTIYMQDEMIGNWHKGLFGKQVQHSILGRLKAKLKEQPNVHVICKTYPTTKLCYNCGTLHKDITLSDREFICPSCGFSEERDLKAAKTVLFIGQCKNTYAPTDHRSTNVERMSDFIASYEAAKHSSMKHGS